MASKINQKINAFFDSKNIDFWIPNGSKMEPKWTPKSENSWTFRATLPRRLQGGQMEAKELENGAKMAPKGSQMEGKWKSKRAKTDLKSMKNEAPV